MKFILGKKLEMTRKFKDDGRVIPVTVVEAGPCVVTEIKTKAGTGYDAVQLGFGEKKKINKPLAGHLRDLGKFRYLKEFRGGEQNLKRGDKIGAAIFEPGDMVQVKGISKGRGFQGVVKRHHFHGHPKTHGHKDQLRMPGSIGATAPQRVFKGLRMAGRMGGEHITVKNLEIVEVDRDKNLLYIKGAVPGARNSLVEIAGLPNNVRIKS